MRRLHRPHLRSACDHVLHVIGMAGAVHVGVMPVLGLVLDCSIKGKAAAAAAAALSVSKGQQEEDERQP